MQKKFFHKPENGKNGFKFLKRQKINAFGNEIDDESEENEN